jgi:hypothetical protein
MSLRNFRDMPSLLAGVVSVVVGALSFFIAAPERKIEPQHPIVLSAPNAADTDLAKLTQINGVRLD